METFALDRAAILTLDKTRRFSSSGIERFCLSLPALLARSSTSALGYELLSTHIRPNVSSALRSRLSFCRHRESASGQKRTLAPIGRRCRFSARIIPIADICIECSSTVRPELADVCFRGNANIGFGPDSADPDRNQHYRALIFRPCADAFSIDDNGYYV